MKHLLLTTIAAVLLVGCGKSQQESIAVDMILKSATADIDPKSSIQNAAKVGNIEAVKKHLTSGVDVNDDAGFGMTALQNAAAFGHSKVVELLIANGADVNAKDEGGRTPLDMAFVSDFMDSMSHQDPQNFIRFVSEKAVLKKPKELRKMVRTVGLEPTTSTV